MPRKYIPHPRTGFEEFLTFIVRYAYYNYPIGMSIHQRSVGNFLNKDHKTIGHYIVKAISLGLLEEAGKGFFSLKQKNESTIYNVKLKDLNDYLKNEKGIMAFEDPDEAFGQVVAFMESLNNEEKKKREKNNERNVSRAIREYCHCAFNNRMDEFNEELKKRGLSKFADRYLLENRLRASNIICGTKNPENHKDPTDPYYGDLRRYELLQEFGISNRVEFDVNGSMYRLCYNLRHEEQLSQEVDIYYLFWKELGFGLPFDKEVKKHIKKACMPIFIKEHGIKESLKYYEKYKECENSPVKLLLDKGEKERMEAYDFLTNYTNVPLKNILYPLRKAMKRVLGLKEDENFMGKNIFLYESDLHIEMKMILLEQGILVINCYDGFYGEEGVFTKEKFEDAYYKAINEVKGAIEDQKFIDSVNAQSRELELNADSDEEELLWADPFILLADDEWFAAYLGFNSF